MPPAGAPQTPGFPSPRPHPTTRCRGPPDPPESEDKGASFRGFPCRRPFPDRSGQQTRPGGHPAAAAHPRAARRRYGRLPAANESGGAIPRSSPSPAGTPPPRWPSRCQRLAPPAHQAAPPPPSTRAPWSPGGAQTLPRGARNPTPPPPRILRQYPRIRSRGAPSHKKLPSGRRGAGAEASGPAMAIR